jgi:hypothetical protein
MNYCEAIVNYRYLKREGWEHSFLESNKPHVVYSFKETYGRPITAADVLANDWMEADFELMWKKAREATEEEHED